MDPKPPAPASVWTVLSSAAAVLAVMLVIVGGVGSIIIGGLEKDLAERKNDIDKINLTMAPLLTLYAQHTSDKEAAATLQKQVDSKLDKDIYEAFLATSNSRITTLETTDKQSLDEALHQIHDLEGNIVTRAENVFHWNAVDALTLRMNGLTDKACAAKGP
jgi:hypothetical protein